MENPHVKAARLLAKIRALDSSHWSNPSNSLALKIHDLEREYSALTGRDCPEWPRRLDWQLSSKIRHESGLTGRAAYDADCMAVPLYHDGSARPSWESLDGETRYSWERPKPA